MGSYVYGLIAVGVAAAVAELLTVGNKGYVRLVAGLCILLACIQPLREGVSYLRDLAEGDLDLSLPPAAEDAENYGDMFNGYLSDTGRREVESWVETALTDVFGISREHFSVEARMTVREGVPCPEEIYISLQGKAILKNPHQIEDYISSRMTCPCHVFVGTGE